MHMQVLFVLTGDGLVRLERRRVPDFFSGQFNGDGAALCIHFSQDVRDDEHAAAAEPRAGLHHEVAHPPVLVAEIEFADRADVAIGCGQGAAAQFFEWCEHMIPAITLVSFPPCPNIVFAHSDRAVAARKRG